MKGMASSYQFIRSTMWYVLHASSEQAVDTHATQHNKTTREGEEEEELASFAFLQSKQGPGIIVYRVTADYTCNLHITGMCVRGCVMYCIRPIRSYNL